jgi:spermidine synthase
LLVLLFLLFFGSGLSSLVLEIIWLRKLVLIFGSTSFAVSTIIAAFMGGLGLGSWIFGRMADRIRSHVLLYGLIEAAIGLYALLVPFIFAASVPLYRVVWDVAHLSFYPYSLLRFLLACVVLLLPTTLMGATLPLLSRAVVQTRGEIGARVGRLYAANTFGAVTGTFLCGFVLLPALGEFRSTLAAACVNFLIAATAIAAFRRKSPTVKTPTEEGAPLPPQPAPVEPPPLPAPEAVEGPGPARTILLALGLAGFASMTLQVAWARLFYLIIGSSTYAYSVLLTTFLAGLALGAHIASRLLPRLRHPATAFAWTGAGIGVSVLLGLLLIPVLFFLYVKIFNAERMSFLLFVNFLLAFIIIFPPTVGMGALFPLGIAAYGRRVRLLGRKVGEAYAVNTGGSILGGFVAGFVLLPLCGMQTSIRAAAAAYAVVAVLPLLKGVRLKRWHALNLGLAAVVGVSAVLLPAGASPHLLSSGVFRYAQRYDLGISFRQFREKHSDAKFRIVRFEEGVTTTVSVLRYPATTAVTVNGKVDGSSLNDMPTQTLSAHFPMLFVANPRNVMIIGYGTGVTVGAAGLYPDVRITCVELEPAILRAGRHFRHVNYDTDRLREEGRLTVLENDARNILLVSPETYDVIISEPSNAWITGASKLFTQDSFRLVRDRLNPGGVFAQWVQIYGMDTRNIRCLVKTFQSVFPDVMIFTTIYKSDLILIGRRDAPLELSLKKVEALFSPGAIAGDLERVGVRTPVDFLVHFLQGPRGVRRYVDADPGLPLNTDDNAYIEFHAPRTMYLSRGLAVMKSLSEFAESPLRSIRLEGDAEDQHRFLLKLAGEALDRRHFFQAGAWIDAVEEHARSAGLVEAGETPPIVSYFRARLGTTPGPGRTASPGGGKGWIPFLETFLARNPDYFRAWQDLGRALEEDGRTAEAAEAYGRAVALAGGEAIGDEPTFRLGTLLVRLGRFDEALGQLGKIRDGKEGKIHFLELPLQLGLAEAGAGRPGRAAAHLMEQIRRTPDVLTARKKLLEISRRESWPRDIRELMDLPADKKRSKALWAEGDRLRADGDRQGALDKFLEACRADVFGYLRFEFLGNWLMDAGRFRDAERLWDRVLPVYGYRPVFRMRYAYLLELLGDRTGEREYYRRARTVLAPALDRTFHPAMENEFRNTLARLGEKAGGALPDGRSG